MSNKQGLLCIDWDGTLVDTTPGIVHAVSQTLGFLNLPNPGEENIKRLIGESEEVISAYYFKDNIELAKEFWPHFRSLYIQLPHPTLMKGARTFLENHQDFYIAIVTNKRRKMLDNEINKYNIDQYIDYTYTADSYIAKPDPAMILQAMLDCEASKHNTWMLGDSEADEEAAQRAAVNFVAIHAQHWHPHSSTLENLIIKRK